MTIEAKTGQSYYYQIQRTVKTVKNPDYSFGAGLASAIASAAMNTTGGSSKHPFINEVTITVNPLSKEEARALIEKYNPPKIIQE